MPRPRYDQLMSLGWKILLPLTLFNILLTGAIGIWILSFLLIQYVSIERSLLASLRIPYAAAFLVAVLLSFGWQLPPLVVLFLFNLVFAVLLLMQLRVFGAFEHAF